jgi:nucleotide-binding universal stress UspA family protein
VELIVRGFSRRGELMTRLFGSVTVRVLQQAPLPGSLSPVIVDYR